MRIIGGMSENLYESDTLLGQYLHFHYASAADYLPYAFGPKEALNFPQRCVADTLDLNGLPERARALDVGCAVGGSTFALARYCQEVIGIDYSSRFIGAAQQLAKEGSHRYRQLLEGETSIELTAQVPDEIDRSRVRFEAGDATALRPDLGSFEVVLACNLICRLPEPMRFLERLPALVKPGGQLVITTPFTWLEDYTPRHKWLGGREISDSFEGLRSALEPAFELRTSLDMPFLIRETARKYQWTVAQGSVWQRL